MPKMNKIINAPRGPLQRPLTWLCSACDKVFDLLGKPTAESRQGQMIPQQNLSAAESTEDSIFEDHILGLVGATSSTDKMWMEYD